MCTQNCYFKKTPGPPPGTFMVAPLDYAHVRAYSKSYDEQKLRRATATMSRRDIVGPVDLSVHANCNE
jgi:hypothetical protein